MTKAPGIYLIWFNGSCFLARLSDLDCDEIETAFKGARTSPVEGDPRHFVSAIARQGVAQSLEIQQGRDAALKMLHEMARGV